jgi:hypothetical protein
MTTNQAVATQTREYSAAHRQGLRWRWSDPVDRFVSGCATIPFVVRTRRPTDDGSADVGEV